MQPSEKDLVCSRHDLLHKQFCELLDLFFARHPDRNADNTTVQSLFVWSHTQIYEPDGFEPDRENLVLTAIKTENGGDGENV